MKLYHGSTLIVDNPKVNRNEKDTDFGPGFYLTTSLEQAIKWAKTKMHRKEVSIGYVSFYDFDFDINHTDLKFRQFKQADVKWLRFVTNNRNGITVSNKADLTIGPVADDNVYKTIRFFETGVYDEDETIKRLKTETLHDQWVIHTSDAIKLLKFEKFVEVTEEEK